MHDPGVCGGSYPSRYSIYVESFSVCHGLSPPFLFRSLPPLSVSSIPLFSPNNEPDEQQLPPDVSFSIHDDTRVFLPGFSPCYSLHLVYWIYLTNICRIDFTIKTSRKAVYAYIRWFRTTQIKYWIKRPDYCYKSVVRFKKIISIVSLILSFTIWFLGFEIS